ncbi:MAG: DNA polymerase III subunit delta' [Desulfovibrio sp.]|nr:DNA polymerase III subunit delta' [Desulfovibrio sp.]
MREVLPELAGPGFDRLVAILNGLGAAPPQVLLFEGGTEAQRLALSHYWAARVCCPEAVQTGAPCLSCPVCRQIRADEYMDLLSYDARISNREDLENPGGVRAMSIENIRALKAHLRDAPHGPRRVVSLLGLERVQRGSAANGLLKALEEPSETTLFVILAPMRQQILPTLVSRSQCLTLPWPDSHAAAEGMRQWEEMLAAFLATGRGFLDKVSAKGAVDIPLARGIILACRQSLLRVYAGEASGPLDALFARLDVGRRFTLSQWLAEGEAMLGSEVTPPRVIESLAMRLCVLLAG